MAHPQILQKHARRRLIAPTDWWPDGYNHAYSWHRWVIPLDSMAVPMYKILIPDDLSAAGLDLLKADPEISVTVVKKMPRVDLLAQIADYDALIVRSETKVDAEVIERGIRLRVVGRAGIGVDTIDVDAATRRGIIVMNTPQANTIATCEHTIAMMLAIARNIAQADASLRRGEWTRSKFMGEQLMGKTLGVIGLGRIGTQVARRAGGCRRVV